MNTLVFLPLLFFLFLYYVSVTWWSDCSSVDIWKCVLHVGSMSADFVQCSCVGLESKVTPKFDVLDILICQNGSVIG